MVGQRLGILTFADDVVLMSESAEGLERMLREADRYGNEMRVTFSGEKSRIMIVNKPEEDDRREWRIGGGVMREVKEYQYLGVWVGIEGFGRELNEKVLKRGETVGKVG